MASNGDAIPAMTVGDILQRGYGRTFPAGTTGSTARHGYARRWRAACGGSEVPFTYGGRRWLYVWDGERHGYLDMDTDTVYRDYRDGAREVL